MSDNTENSLYSFAVVASSLASFFAANFVLKYAVIQEDKQICPTDTMIARRQKGQILA